MKKKIFNLNFFILIILILSACSDPNINSQLTILPQECEMPISSEITLTLNGPIESNSTVEWQADLGSLVYNATGFTAVYSAPAISGQARITATVISGSTNSKIDLTVICHIFDPNDLYTQTSTIITSTFTPTSLDQSVSSPTIIISELMGNPCGDLSQRKYNQYVELYNYGTQAVDVGGWWLYDEGVEGTPDRLVAWQNRSSVNLGEGVVFDSTMIAPGGIAVVLSPQYTQNLDLTKTPYKFPSGTVILTVSETDTLGDDYFGIIADQNGYDTLTLYIGGAAVINQVIDTYGTPNIPSAYPFEIQDDFKDNIPTYLSECSSIERINPSMSDSDSNWKILLNGSPGEFPRK